VDWNVLASPGARALPAESRRLRATASRSQDEAPKRSAALSREDTLRTRLDREIAPSARRVARYRAQQVLPTTPAPAPMPSSTSFTFEAELSAWKTGVRQPGTHGEPRVASPQARAVESLAAALDKIANASVCAKPISTGPGPRFCTAPKHPSAHRTSVAHALRQVWQLTQARPSRVETSNARGCRMASAPKPEPASRTANCLPATVANSSTGINDGAPAGSSAR